ncbi:CPBP family intramembrane metalloprotease [Pedobacter sp. SD-b]|uniref:CPBP family intramembrane metalloprotease n=1 Tax=Pedobacter segetis TaxID=2793069 RepID=A0ABS1BEV1_9SPHI|nr:CPBP family glutamic-type intramembrane protease [Pedobacter segetis]MBK0381393.1 CPBP family intramembrane metalloprotease [Pedobacter segetis]
MVQQLLADFFGYLKNPDPFLKQKYKFMPYQHLMVLLVLALVVSSILESSADLLVTLKIILPQPASIVRNNEYSKLKLLLEGVCIAPVLEECIFRYQLRSFTAANFFVGFSIIYGVYDYLNTYGEVALCLLVLIAIIIFNNWLNKDIRVKFKFKFIKSTFPTYFYLIVLIFGLVHSTNFINYKQYGFAIIIWVLPQMFGGLILGFTRMKYGLYSAIMLHCTYNLFSIGTFILFGS